MSGYSTVVQIVSNDRKFLPHGKNINGVKTPCTVVVNGQMKGMFEVTFMKIAEPDKSKFEKRAALSRLFRKKNG